MDATCSQAIQSLRDCARMCIRKAKQFRKEGRERMAIHYAAIALASRRDANALRF